MIALPWALVGPAREAGIPVPDENEWDKEGNWPEEKYLRFTVYVNAQVGQPLPWPSAHWDNAKVIAKVPEEKLKVVTLGNLKRMGFRVGYSK